MKPFHYRNLGSMATVGRNRAVAEFSKVKMQGWFAWVMWLVVHLRSILGVRNKVIVLLNWVWNYFTYDQSMRMIVYARKEMCIRDREEAGNRETLNEYPLFRASSSLIPICANGGSINTAYCTGSRSPISRFLSPKSWSRIIRKSSSET